MRSLRVVSIALLVSSAQAKKALPVEIPKGFVGDLIDNVMSMILTTWDTSLGLATDALGLILAVPNTAVDVYVWGASFVRSVPDLIARVARGDGSTLNNLSSYAADMAAIIFCTYAALTALNLALACGLAVLSLIHI